MSSIIVSCEAVVLRNLRHGETSRVATLFTRELGKVGVIAKGVRDAKSPFGASLEILSLSSFVLYHRAGRDLQFLRSGCLEREFRGLLRHPARYLWACACAEFLDRVTLPGEAAPALFDLQVRALEVMESAPEISLPELFRAWQLRVIALLGYAPRLEQCLECGRPVPAGGADPSLWTFDPAGAGALCPVCADEAAAAGHPGGISLPPRALRRLRAMVGGNGPRSRGEGLVREISSEETGAARPGPAADRAATAGPAADRLAGNRAAPPVDDLAAVPSDGAWTPATAPWNPGPSAPAGDSWTASRAWRSALHRLVEEYLRYHLDSYRGLRALEVAARWRSATVLPGLSGGAILEPMEPDPGGRP